MRHLSKDLILLFAIFTSIFLSVSSHAAGGGGCIAAPSGIVSWWKAESNAFDVVDGNHGTLMNGAGFGPGKVFLNGTTGSAFSFDGTDDYVRVPDAQNLRFTNAMTIEAWIFPTAFQSPANEIVSRWDAPSGSERSYTFKCDPAGALVFHLSGDGSSVTVANATSTNALALNQWSHVAGTYDGSTIKVYINGAVGASTPWSGGIFPGLADLGIGSALIAGSPFSGLVDEVSLYNRALSQSELQGIYFNGSTGKCFTASAPVIGTQPQNQTVPAGSNATFTVTATGSAPLQYQWRKGTNGISGATASSYTVINAQTNDAGLYSVLVSNTYGFVLSSNALLTVLPASNTCFAGPSGAISWWRAEGNGNDSVDSNLAYLYNGVSFTSGMVGQAFSFDGTNDAIVVSNSPSMNFVSNQNFSIEGWIRPLPSATDFDIMSIVDKRLTFDLTHCQGYEFNLASGQLHCRLSDSTVDNGTEFGPAGPDLRDGNFHHVALTLNRSATNGGNLYVDGVSVLTFNPTVEPGALANNEAFRIGVHADGGVHANFKGQIDELAYYGRALSGTEIQSIYNAGTFGKCGGFPPSIDIQPQSQTVFVGSNATFTVAVSGSSPMFYQWRKGTNGVSGATNFSYTITNAQTNDAGLYSVQVFNAYGSVFSSNALLTVLTPTNSCFAAPAGLVSWWRAEGNPNDAADANNGTLYGNTIYGSGRVGQAFVFDGQGDGVALGNPANLQLQDFTIETWIRRASASAVSLEANGNGTIYGYGHNGYGFYLDPSGHPALTKADINNVTLSTAITDTNFHHLAVTKGGSTVIFYIDGVSNAVFSYNPGFTFTTSAGIGGVADLQSYGFWGRIDEVSFYNRPLTAGEVQSIYNAGTAGKCPPSGTPPVITGQPQNRTVNVGSNATFNVTASGTAPLQYQWRKGTNGISGATASSYTVVNAQTNDAGSYSVVVSNAFGSVLSSNAALTVITPSNNCAPPPPGLVSWWRAESNAQDVVGGNSGTLMNGAGFDAGKVGQSFSLDGVNDSVQVSDGPSLRFTNAVTIEAWVFPRVQGGHPREIASKIEGGVNQRSYTLSISADPATLGRAYFLVSADGGFTQLGQVQAASALPTNQWSHVAATYDGTLLKIYVNGVMENSLSWSNGIFPGTAPLVIGSTLTSGSYFGGLIDELSLYGRALAASEIQSIYNAGSNGKCFTPAAPSITTQPTNQTVAAGGSASFGVSATGTAPLAYQWRLNGTNVAGATNALLSLSNVQNSQAGNYSVRITNVVGSIISSNALLTVTSAPACVPPPTGLVSWWRAESNAQDVVGGNSGTLMNGASFDAGKVGQSFSFDGVNDSVQVSDAPSLRFTNAVTIEAWVFPRVLGGHPREIVSKIEGGVNQRSYTLSISADPATLGRAYFLVSADGGFTQLGKVQAASALPTNQWSHVAATYDGTLLKIYVNGVMENSLSWSNGIFPGTAPLVIGSTLTSGSYFGGLIDELSLYGRALTASEIQAIYNAGSAGKCSTSGDSPSITSQPQSVAVNVGSNATFTVAATGTSPLSYQWRKGTNGVLGATNTSYTISNAQTNDAGSYSVLVSNAFGFVFSSNATLTVISTSNTCVGPASGLVSWWPGETNANDIVGSNNGILHGGLTFGPGEVGQAFVFNGTNAYVSFAANPSLNVGTSSGFTIECWIYPTDVSTTHLLAEYNNGSGGVGAHWYHSDAGIGGLGALAADIVSTTGADHIFASAPNLITRTNFQHVALSYDKTTGVAKLYRNGVVVASQNMGSFTPQTTYPLNLGVRVSGAAAVGSYYAGSMDETSLYNRALTDAEIVAIYNAGSTGKCPPSGTPPIITGQPQDQTVNAGSNATFNVTATGTTPLQYQWRKGTNGISGATASFYTVVNAQTNDAGLYSVLVSNAYGFVFSSNALLTVLTPSNSPCFSLPSGAVSWWRAETNAFDSLDSNNGTFYGTNSGYSLGEVGSAFSLNGSSGHVRVSDRSNLRFTTTMTAEAWINVASVGNPQGIAVKWGATPGPAASQLCYSFSLEADGRLYLQLSGDGTASVMGQADSSNSVPVGQWVHVAGTYDGATIRVYVNGSLQGQIAYTQGIFPGTNDLAIGGVVGGVPPGQLIAPFNGRIDEVTLYARALTQSEIQGIFNADGRGKCLPSGTPPVITGQPQNQTVNAGSNATFNVTATGTSPLFYQWRKATNGISGATASSYAVVNAQTNDAGIYSVLVSNAFGFVFSSNATLTVITSSNTCVAPASGIVAWWPGETNANDIVDSNNGVLHGGLSFGPGKVGQAFLFNGTNAYVSFAANPSLNVGTSNGFTIECWIYPTDVSTTHILGEYNNGSIPGVHWYHSDAGIGGLGALAADIVSTTGVDHIFASAPNLITRTNFQHVALSYDKPPGVAKLYRNGVVVASQNMGSFTPQTTYPLNLGVRVAGLAAVGSYYAGSMDETSLYNRALTDAEILAIYNAGSTGKCPPSGTPPIITGQPQNQTVNAGSNATFNVTATGTAPLQYQWRKGTNGISGATATSYTVVNAQTNDAGLYSVLVSNAYGFVFSSNATLTVITTPANSNSPCLNLPSGAVSWWRAESNANDSVDSNTGLLLNGISFTNGMVGQAFNFDGVDDGIIVSNAPSLNFASNQNFSIEAWIRPLAHTTDFDIMSIVDKRNAPDLTHCQGYEFNLASGRIHCRLSDSASDNGTEFGPAGPDLRDGNFHHVALTLARSSSNGGRLWVDGQTVLIFDPTSEPGDLSNGEFFQIGYHASPFVNAFFKGQIDELTLYNRALATNEIAAIYNAGSAGKCPSNHPPVVHDMIAATMQNLPMTIPGDKFVLLASDPDNDPLSLMSVSATSTNGGSVVLNSGQVTYAPTANYMGPDRFTFTISDNHGGTASAAVLLNVRSANEISGNMLPPVAASNGYRVSFLGIPGRTYTLQRATNVHGPWLSIGGILAGPSGLGSFTDTNPPPVSAFYRTTYP